MEQPNWTKYLFARLDVFWTGIFLKSVHMDYALYEKDEMQNAQGKAIEAADNNNTGVEGFYHQNIRLLASIIGIVTYSIVLANVHPLVVILLLGLSLIQYAFHYISAKYEEKNRAEQSRRYRHQMYLFDQSADVKNGKDVRLFQLQHWLTELFIKYNKEYHKQLSKNERLFYLYDFVGLLLNLIRDGACYGYLIYLLTKGMDFSQFVLYLGVVSGFGSWFQKISDEIANLSRSTKLICHYRNYMDMADVYMHGAGKKIEVEEGVPFDITFEHMSFKYPESEKLVLEDISFEIKKGEKLALVGINGAGKTTLVKMLCGFYRPTSGRVLINGMDITELDIEKYFEQISVLFQDSILLSYTIAENIAGKKWKKSIERNYRRFWKRVD
ncbi:MAG: ABC transporter ATP-binding protein [Schaedlerella sp.]|nr:ABC transporter ATP-binding protein [Schaedlerella sp.]